MTAADDYSSGCGRSWIPGRKSVIIGRKGALSTTDDIRCSGAVLDQRLIGELARMKSRQLGISTQVYLHNNETLWFFAWFCLWPLARLYRGTRTSCRFTGLGARSHPTRWGRRVAASDMWCFHRTVWQSNPPVTDRWSSAGARGLGRRDFNFCSVASEQHAEGSVHNLAV